MPYGMTNSTTFREFGKRLGLPDKTIRRELDKFCTSYPLLDTLIANSYLSDELKENYRNMYLGRRDSYLKSDCNRKRLMGQQEYEAFKAKLREWMNTHPTNTPHSKRR